MKLLSLIASLFFVGLLISIGCRQTTAPQGDASEPDANRPIAIDYRDRQIPTATQPYSAVVPDATSQPATHTDEGDRSKLPATAPTASTDEPKATAIDPLTLRIRETQGLLRRYLWQHARDPNNPWLIAHALLAFDKDLKMADGQFAIDRIVSGFLQFKTIGGVEIPYFQIRNGDTPIEPHPFLQVKTLLEVGVPLSREFRVGGRTVKMADLLKGVYLLHPANINEDDLGQYAWSYFLLYDHLPDNAWSWPNAESEQVVFVRLLWRAIAFLERQTSFLHVLKDRGVEVIPKLEVSKQHIYAEPCGGLHLIQGVMRWAAHPVFRQRLQPLLNAQIDLMFYRLNGETKLYMDLYQKKQKHAGYGFIVLLQQLKFLGHLLESFGDLHKWGLFNPHPTQRRHLRHGLELLNFTIHTLDKLGWYRRIDELKTRSYQLYLDLLGDSAHALHALNMIQRSKLYRE
jgi:hypothetical protein